MHRVELLGAALILEEHEFGGNGARLKAQAHFYSQSEESPFLFYFTQHDFNSY